MTEDVEADPWAGGFFDAEGSVIHTLSENRTRKLDYQIQPAVQITHKYVAGFFDGDGTVACEVVENGESVDGYQQRLKAQIIQNEHDPLLQKLDDFAEQIGITYNVAHVGGGESSPGFQWNINERESLRTFLTAIRPYTVVKREQIDIMLDELLPRFEAGKHLHRRGFLEVMAWRDVLNSLKGGNRGKYNLPYFEDKWGMRLDEKRMPDGYERPRDG